MALEALLKTQEKDLKTVAAKADAATAAVGELKGKVGRHDKDIEAIKKK